MAKRIVGAYKTEDEALQVIDELETEGYLTSNIQILTTNKDSDNLKGSTDVLVESGETESEKEGKQSIIDKIKSALPFTDDPEDPSVVRSRLVEIGVPLDEASKYAPAGESGTIFVIAEEFPDGNTAGGTSKVKLVAKEGNLSNETLDTDPGLANASTTNGSNMQDSITPVEDTNAANEEDLDKSTEPAIEKMNPPLNSNQALNQQAEHTEVGENDRPVSPNPPIGGIDAAQGNTDTEPGRDEGVPDDHHRTPLDKTEKDINNPRHDRNTQKKSDK